MRKRRRGSALVAGALLAVVVAALSAVLLGSAVAHKQAVAQNIDAVRAREAGERAVALRLLACAAGDLETLESDYVFADRSEARVRLHPIDAFSMGLDIASRRGLVRSRLLVLFKGGAAASDEVQPSFTRGNLFLANNIDFRNNNRAFLPFDSRLGLPSASNSSGKVKVFANKTITMTNQTRISGSVTAGQKIVLENNSQVSDTVRAPSVVVKNQASYGILDNTPPELIPLPNFDALIDTKLTSALAAAQNRGNFTIPNKGEVRIGPDEVVRYGNFDTGNKGVLRIEGPATVIFSSLLVNNNSEIHIRGAVTLLFDGTGSARLRNQAVFVMPDRGDGYADAHVEIYSKGSHYWENNGNIGGVPPRPSDFQVYMYSNKLRFELQNQSYFWGSIFNPGGTLEMRNNTQFYGFAMADYVDLQNQSSLYYDLALDSELVMPGESEPPPAEDPEEPEPAAGGWRVSAVSDQRP